MSTKKKIKKLRRKLSDLRDHMKAVEHFQQIINCSNSDHINQIEIALKNMGYCIDPCKKYYDNQSCDGCELKKVFNDTSATMSIFNDSRPKTSDNADIEKIFLHLLCGKIDPDEMTVINFPSITGLTTNDFPSDTSLDSMIIRLKNMMVYPLFLELPIAEQNFCITLERYLSELRVELRDYKKAEETTSPECVEGEGFKIGGFKLDNYGLMSGDSK